MRPALLALPALLFVSCNATGEGVANGSNGPQAAAGAATAQGGAGQAVTAQPIVDFDEPWAMTFLPGGERALVTEKPGRLKLWQVASNQVTEIAGVPKVDYGGQGGLGDVVLHPNFASNNIVYLSYAEAGDGDTRGAAVARGRLVLEGGQPRLEGMNVIWRQSPKVTGRGHYGHRLAFGPDGKLYVSNGDRQKFDPAQDMNAHLGKILRLNDDGSVPADNPFASRGGVSAQIWSLGHRNPLGIVFDRQGRLWEHEMGPAGGDEFNLIERGSNYGYPIVSNGDHYDGRKIPDHDTRPEFNAPEISWTPVISPAGLIQVTGDRYPGWRDSFLIGGLSALGLVRVTVDGDTAREAERIDLGARIREVEQAPDGTIYVLEDERDGAEGRLLKLNPPR